MRPHCTRARVGPVWQPLPNSEYPENAPEGDISLDLLLFFIFVTFFFKFLFVSFALNEKDTRSFEKITINSLKELTVDNNNLK